MDTLYILISTREGHKNKYKGQNSKNRGKSKLIYVKTKDFKSMYIRVYSLYKSNCPSSYCAYWKEIKKDGKGVHFAYIPFLKDYIAITNV